MSGHPTGRGLVSAEGSRSVRVCTAVAQGDIKARHAYQRLVTEQILSHEVTSS